MFSLCCRVAATLYTVEGQAGGTECYRRRVEDYPRVSSLPQAAQVGSMDTNFLQEDPIHNNRLAGFIGIDVNVSCGCGWFGPAYGSTSIHDESIVVSAAYSIPSAF